MTDFSLVLVDERGDASFGAAEAKARQGLAHDFEVVRVRRTGPGWEGMHEPGELLVGPDDSRHALIRLGVEHAQCPQVVVLEISALSFFEGAAELAIELRDSGAGLVAAQVLDRDGVIVFRSGAVALDGRGGAPPARALPSELRLHAPTLVNDPRAFAVDRDTIIAAWRLGPESSDPAASGELAWHCWLAGREAVGSRALSVVESRPEIPSESPHWKASLGRLLSDELLARTPEAAAEAGGFDAERVARRLLRAGGVATDEIEPALRLRRAIQSARTVPDSALVEQGLLGDPQAVLAGPALGRRRRVAVLCSDAIGTSMAGPAIRTVELARVLCETGDVRIGARLGEGRPDGLPCPLHALNSASVRELLEWADAVVLQGPLTDWYPEVLRSKVPIAVDLYDPMNLEALESPEPESSVPYTTNLLHDQLWRGDYFFCASERQRDFWLGMLAGAGRITPGRYEDDPDLDGLIGIVPYGISEDAPVAVGPGVRSTLPGVGPDDPLFVWNGGIWQWFDPDLLVLAIDRLRAEIPTVRALFMGIRRPGSELTEEALRLSALVDRLGLRDEHVFLRNWTPYAERADTYLDATAVVSLHHAHIETRFSFRTRLLDCIWASTPMICTSGDVLAPVVVEEDVGLTVAAGDLDAIVDAMREIALDGARVAEMRDRLRALSHRYHWAVAARPLVAWCDSLPARREERFLVQGLDAELSPTSRIAQRASELKLLIPRPVRQYVLGPVKRRLADLR